MRRHISVHRATTKYFSNSFVFKNEIEKEGLPRDITPALGAGGPEFKSRRPDHLLLCFQCTVSLPGVEPCLIALPEPDLAKSTTVQLRRISSCSTSPIRQ